ncbi:aldehyde dehydrogenase family protein [Oricola sp.]|uniref:aldehyde dehydrogenase family protein n=1 Tax=Oricola sp. TaxID=1979950 RepID=UPI003BAB91AF
MTKHVLYHELSTMRGDVRAFLDQPKKHFIGGDFVDGASGETFWTEDPGLEIVLADVQSGNQSDVDAAVEAARRAFEGEWTAMVPAARAACMFKLADLIYENLDQLAELEGLDTGKPAHVAKALELPFAAEVFRYYGGWATKVRGSTLDLSLNPEKFHAYTRSEPVGVVAGIIPWNFPLAQAAFKIAPALAVGCTAVLKPAEQTPLTALRLAELVVEAGFPAGTINVVTGYGHTAGAALAAHPGVDKVTFTGSTETGRRIIAAAGASNLKRLTLELGGKSPLIIFADADMERAIPTAAAAIFGNAGQVCNAGSRLYVEASAYDRVVEGVVEIGRNMQLGCALDGSSEIGPLMSKTQLDRVTSMVDAARGEGVSVLCGGGREGEKGHFYAPTVLTGMDTASKIATEEIFGPVLCAMSFDDEEAVLAEANRTNYGLAASIWTENAGRAHRMAAGVKAGAVWINSFGVFDPNLPFGGFKESGWGREFGPEGMAAFIETKAVSMHIGG